MLGKKGDTRSYKPALGMKAELPQRAGAGLWDGAAE